MCVPSPGEAELLCERHAAVAAAAPSRAHAAGLCFAVLAPLQVPAERSLPKAAEPMAQRCALLPLPLVQAIVQRMSGELVRFQRERAQEMAYVLRDFAIAEAKMSSDSARLWRSMVPGLAQTDAQ